MNTGEKVVLAAAVLYIGWAAYRAAFRNIPFVDGLKHPGATDWRPNTVLTFVGQTSTVRPSFGIPGNPTGRKL